jgi:L-threonylcarbamoyladenylate synthase
VTELLAPAEIARAAALLRQGELVAFPTETVYGLGGDATSDRAVAAIFAAKDRPAFNPLIVHVPGVNAAVKLAFFDQRAHELARRFWPGPLSLVLPRAPDCRASLLACAGLDTVALRAPAHELAQALLRATGPLAAPSANRSGYVSPTTAAHVMEELGGRIAAVLDGGPCKVGIESTVLDLSGKDPVLLRPGAVTRKQLAAILGPVADASEHDAKRSPGMLERHYAPSRPLRLDAKAVMPDEALIAFGPDALSGGATTVNLSPTGDMTEAAANLFAALRRLDNPKYAAIAVMPIPAAGLGLAINDRLARAARGR